MKETIHRAMDVLYLACIWGAGICIVLMSLFIPWGIFTRYVLGTGSQWPEPISILLMVVFTFFGAAAAYRAGAHIAVAMVTDRVPAQARNACRWIVHLLMFTVSMFALVYGAKLCIGTWGQSIPELTWMPVGFTYLPIPLGGLFTALFVLEHVVLGDQSRRAVVTYDWMPEEAAHAEGTL